MQRQGADLRDLSGDLPVLPACYNRPMTDDAVPSPLGAISSRDGPGDRALTSDGATRRHLLELAFYLRLAREWDLRFEKLFRLGQVSKWYSSVGNEACTVAAADRLESGDALCTLHRDSGAILRYYVDVEDLAPGLLSAESSGRRGPRVECGDSLQRLYRLACQLMGRAHGYSAGYERSYHYGAFDEAAGLLHVGMISHLGAMVPVAAGLGLASRLAGGDRVALNFLGDGGTSTGEFHEGLNMAGVLDAPLVLVIENNRYAFSTPVAQQSRARSFADRAIGYGIAGERVDGNDPLAVSSAVGRAVDRARAGAGPTLIEAMVGRLRGHSEGDDSLARVPAEERQRFEREDPVTRFEDRLLKHGVIQPSVLDAIARRSAEIVLEVADRALAAPPPDLSAPHRSVFQVVETIEVDASLESSAEVELSYLGAVGRALRDALAEDPTVVLLGQDIAEFGGAFKVTRGLVEEFGVERVINTPIAEAGTLGIAAGLALADKRPIVEMQFADFVSCGFNQLVNVIAKLYYRMQRSVPLVVRLPTGGGVGAGPFHSQCVEAWFLHVPGLKVVAPSTAEDAYRLLRQAIRDPNPVLFFEHKFLYRRDSGKFWPLDAASAVVEGARVVRPGRHVSCVSWGWMVHRLLEAADLLAEEGCEVEVVDLRVLAPLEDGEVRRSVRRTGRLLVLHEASLTGGFGAEVAARLGTSCFEFLDAPIERLAFADTPIPCNRGLEEQCLPSVEGIVEALRRLRAF